MDFIGIEKQSNSKQTNSTPRRTSIDLFGVKILVIEDTIASPTTVPTLENDGKFLPCCFRNHY